jgi:hypothetical protein
MRGVKTVAVVGRLANTPNTGDQRFISTQPVHVVTPLQGHLAAGGAPFNVSYSEQYRWRPGDFNTGALLWLADHQMRTPAEVT